MRSPQARAEQTGQKDKSQLGRAICVIKKCGASDRGSFGVKHSMGSLLVPCLLVMSRHRDVIRSCSVHSVGRIVPCTFLICFCSPKFQPSVLQKDVHRNISVIQIPTNQLGCGKYQFHDQLIYKYLFLFNLFRKKKINQSYSYL